jgi:hypothetical protein
MTEFSKFAQFVADTKAKHRGHDIAGNPRQYIPRSALDEYWSKKNISLVLASFSPRLNFDVGVIKRQYLRIFSTLVYTGRDTVESLADLFISRNLSDEKLPWRSRPSEWPDELFFRDFFAGMAKHQWQFFPLPFHPDQLHDHRIHDERILPINWGTQIAHGTAASVHAFEIHPEFNHLAPEVCFAHPWPLSIRSQVKLMLMALPPSGPLSSKSTTTKSMKPRTRMSAMRCSGSAPTRRQT